MRLKGLLRLSAWSVLCLALFGLGVLFLFPVRNSLVRLGFLVLVGCCWVCVFCLTWRKRKLRYLLLGITVFAVGFCFMPSRPVNQDGLRDAVVRSLLRYEGRPYLWGAENIVAVDCSGLIRQGFIDAAVLYGLKTFDGALVREGLLLWWHDSSAKAMRDGYRGRTIRLAAADSINELDHSGILPGDFAVTQNGIHCLAYLGEGRWIQADPGPYKVVIGQAPAADSGWFNVPVYLMRWSVFDARR